MELSEAELALVARLEWEVSTPKVTGRRGRLVPVDTPRIFRMDLEKHCRELNLSPPSTIRRFIAHGLIAETDRCGNYFDITGKVLDAAAATLADPQKTPAHRPIICGAPAPLARWTRRQ